MSYTLVETDELRDFTADSPTPTPLLQANQVGVQLLNLSAGQGVGPCQMGHTVIYYVVEGRGSLRVGDHTSTVRKGSLALVSADDVRAISADGLLRVLVIQQK